AWLLTNTGEISAWFIARFGWADASPLFTSAGWLLWWLRWVVGPWLGLTLFAAAEDPERRGSLVGTWPARALGWRLLLVTGWFVLFIALPWRLALWRPLGLPPSWIEGALAAARLVIVATLLGLGAALIVRAAVRRGVPPAGDAPDAAPHPS